MWTGFVHAISGIFEISRVRVSIKLRLGSIKSRQNQFAALFGALSCSAGLLIQINRACCSFISLSQSRSSRPLKRARQKRLTIFVPQVGFIWLRVVLEKLKI